MDGMTVSRFVHQLNTCFDLVELKTTPREDRLLSLYSKGLRIPGIASRVT